MNPVYDKTIVLIGARGSGKSSVGRLLAEKCGFSFIDTDDLICNRAKAPISTIVSQQGWPYLRTLEERTLSEVLGMRSCVVATGGGAVLHEQVFSRHRQRTWVVWLAADPTVLIERIQRDSRSSQNRPSLTGADIVTEFGEIYAARKPLYKRLSHLTINTAYLDREQIVTDILSVVPVGRTGTAQ